MKQKITINKIKQIIKRANAENVLETVVSSKVGQLGSVPVAK